MIDMLVRCVERTLATDGCTSGTAGVSVYGSIALFLKGQEGPAPEFDEFLK
jgi:hypothetical protein